MNSKKLEILNWRINNPEGTKSACAKELKISGSTVAKWWDLYDSEKCPDKVEPCTECDEKKEENLENEVVSESLPEEKEHANEKCSCCEETNDSKEENECKCCDSSKEVVAEFEASNDNDKHDPKEPNAFYKYATYILAIICLLLFIGCVQNTRNNKEPVVPETKTLSIVANDSNKLDYTGDYNWYLDDMGLVYELADDKISVIGQTLASSEVAQADYDGYIEAIKEQFELVPLENLNGYNIVTGEGLNIVVYDAENEIAYEIYLSSGDEEKANEIISSLNLVETPSDSSEAPAETTE